MKTYTGLLHTCLNFWAEYYKILPQNQFGFRKSHSTSHEGHNWPELQQSGDTMLCFVDFKKAFDSIDRKVLLTKLLHFGTGDQMGHAIQSVIKGNMIRILH